MKKKSYFCIQKFKKTRDFEDINYMIRHIADITVRTSVILSMGYKVSRVIQPNDLGVGYLMFSKQGSLLMQITPKYPNCNIALCVKFEKHEFCNWIEKHK